MSQLRNYQQEIIAQVHREWCHHRSVMVQMPTGTGKTHVLASIVKGFSGRILIVAHRIELVEQINSTVDFFLAPTGNQKSEIKVSSIQTVSRRIGSMDFVPDLIIIDEAHHALAKTYRILWEEWPSARFLGLTATPCRMNRAGFTDLFDVLVTSWSMAEFIRKGVLSAFDYVSIRPNSLEQRLIDSLQKRGADGDYQVKEMDLVLNRQPSIERLYQSIVSFAQGMKGMVYAISIDHARKIAAYYNRQGIRTVAIDSRTPKEERHQLVEDFRQGRIQVLVNVDVFSEGFDCPDVEFVQMARPTLSLSKYLQQVGRGLRKSRGKVSCMLIDNVGLCRVFGLPVQHWDWERMFRGELAGKGRITSGEEPRMLPYSVALQEENTEADCGVGLVIGHEALMERLDELEKATATGEKTAELKAWQDTETGLWGLKRGREKRTEAAYVTVFGLKEGLVAVRLQSYECALVDEYGQVVWKLDRCASMKMLRHRLVELVREDGETDYLDVCNGQVYRHKPEVKVYGGFELLKVRNLCYSRTKQCYESRTEYSRMVIADKGVLLKIRENTGMVYALLKGDTEQYYKVYEWLADGGAVVQDGQECFYRITPQGEKCLIAREAIGQVVEQVASEVEADNDRKRKRIWEEQQMAVPFRMGPKWGLKVGGRMTVPPIYRNVLAPVGRYCAVELNYSQWGIVGIDGKVLVEPRYAQVDIDENGTALLTQVNGKQIEVKLR